MRDELKVECCSTSADEVIVSIFTMKVYLYRLIQSTYLLTRVEGDLKLSCYKWIIWAVLYLSTHCCCEWGECMDRQSYTLGSFTIHQPRTKTHFLKYLNVSFIPMSSPTSPNHSSSQSHHPHGQCSHSGQQIGIKYAVYLFPHSQQAIHMLMVLALLLFVF